MVVETPVSPMQSSSSEVGTIYDDVPYISLPFVQAHPNRMAVMATLFGLAPRPIDQCKVLEIGCASGGNIIPMAYTLPGSEFLGIDLSARQVREGKELIGKLNLKNVEIRHLSIMDLPDNIGPFDYIISHGVFSWVADQVQEKILQVCKYSLAPQGIAYISYNTLPGWRVRGMIREMMLYHTSQFKDSSVRVEQGRALIEFLAQTAQSMSSEYLPSIEAYEKLLKNEADFLRNQRDDYILHEYLETTNKPIYFSQFIEQASRHGLQFLSETLLSTMLPGNLPKEAQEGLKRVADNIIKTEQYMDFVKNRTFRETLLCHADQVLNRNIEANKIMSFYIASPAKPAEQDIDVASEGRIKFEVDGAHINTSNAVTKAALLHLSSIWPRSEYFADLLEIARARVQQWQVRGVETDSETDARILASDLLLSFGYNVVTLNTQPDLFTTEINECPRASDLARSQAATQTMVTNLVHRQVTLDIFTRKLLELLNGQHSRAELIELLSKQVVEGELQIRRNGEALQEKEEIRKILEQQVDALLPQIAQSALLVS